MHDEVILVESPFAAPRHCLALLALQQMNLNIIKLGGSYQFRARFPEAVKSEVPVCVNVIGREHNSIQTDPL